MAQYDYSISNDTATGAVNSEQLWIELHSLIAANPGFPALENIMTEGDDLSIFFASALSGAEQGQLTAAVAAHVPAPPVAPSPSVGNQLSNNDPTVDDDATLGYEPSVRWLNVATGEEYLCTDATAAAAVWKSTTSGGGSGSPFTGATPVADGTEGAVIQPLAGQEGLFLRGDATWSPVATVAGDAFDQVYGLGASDGSLSGTVDTVYATVFEPTKSMTLTEIEWFCTTGARDTIHVGIYNEARDTLLAYGETVNPSSGTFYKVTLNTPITLLAGQKYWPAIMAESGGVAYAYSTVAVGVGVSVYTTWNQTNLPPSIAGAGGSSYTPWFGFYGTQSTVVIERSVYGDYYDAGTTSVGTSATKLGLDTERQSNPAFALASDEVTVQAGGAGTYLVTYAVTFDDPSPSSGWERIIQTWLELNGSEVPATRGEAQHWYLSGNGVDGTCGRTCILSLAEGDVLNVQGQVVQGSAGYPTGTGGVGLTITSIGANGEVGPPGPPGAGATVNVEDNGSAIANTPHGTLNFVGFNVSDAGGGVADISQAFGADYQVAMSLPRSTTTSTSWQTKVTLTTSVMTGTYRVSWLGLIDQTNGQDSVEARLYNTTLGAPVGAINRLEPKDTDNRELAGGVGGVVFSNQSMDFEVQWRQQEGGTAGIQNAIIEVWKVS